MGGRIVGVAMLTVGVALLATFSVLSSKARQPVEPGGSGDLQAALAELERLAADHQRATVLRSRIAELESRA